MNTPNQTKRSPLAITFVILLIILGCAYFGVVGYNIIAGPDPEFRKDILKQGSWTLGLPFAGLASFALVLLLPALSEAPLKFKGFSIEVEGPSCQVVLWVLCFLAMTVAIRLVQAPT